MWSSKKLIPSAFLALGLAVSGCSKQAFNIAQLEVHVEGPGKFTIPAKVDILLFQDRSGSMFEAFDQIQTQVPQFLNGLEARGWDYRFAVAPLQNHDLDDARPLDQILTSKFDANYFPLGQWLESFPGEAPDYDHKVPSQFFRTPENYTHFLTASDIQLSLGSTENGFETMDHVINNLASQSNFIRSDSMLILIVMSNGEDTSGVNYCWVGPYQVPCDFTSAPDGSWHDTLDEYEAKLKEPLALKKTTEMHMYSAVGTQNLNNCLGGKSKIGERYQIMANRLDGQHFDICSNPISSILDSISSHLDIIKLDFIQDYIVIGDEPNISAGVQIVKYINGDPNQPVTIPQDDENGWSYEGFFEDKATFVFPEGAGAKTGYFFKLNGSAALVGHDTATVFFTAVGQPSAG